MKFDSPLFDRIRVKPGEDRRERKKDEPGCNWPGCANAGTHRAPKGRTHENQYWRFCLEHVREYNQSYNYFAGMDQDAVAQYQKDSITGHRPTWKMGLGPSTGGRPHVAHFYAGDSGAYDPFGILRGGGAQARNSEPARPDGRTIRNAERKALQTLGLDINALAAEIKARFKELVKRHHPDANGGDRSTEDRLVEIIQAYNYLKSSGLC